MDGQAILLRLTATFGSGIVESHDHRGDHTAVVERSAIRDVLAFCRDDPDLRFDVLMDLTALDYLKYPGREFGPRFEVVYHLYSLPHNHRLRLKVRVDDEGAVVPSAVSLWPIANWFEREVWDMFGIRFDGHPDLRRLLMYEEFQGHPLRKDYPVNKRQPLIGPKN
ncbi:MAG: NADH-quinone oxidoreductase subunit C [Candidatus Rokubacteria bacterium]|nr:NADH-quinone oxidoreductase subunit C [Candidatus Rokubacteria bacterium]